MNHYLVDCFTNITFSNCGYHKCYPPFEQLGPENTIDLFPVYKTTTAKPLPTPLAPLLI